MNIAKFVADLTSLKNSIKRAVPDGGYVTPELLTSVKKSPFALTLQKHNLLKQLDHINVTTFDGTINLTINGKRVSVANFTHHLNKGDLIGALKSIGIPKKNLNYPQIQQRARQFKAQFESSRINRLQVTLAANKTLGAKLQKTFNLPVIKLTLHQVDEVVRKLKTNKIFTKRILAPLYHKLKASPSKIPWLKGLAVGSFTTFVGLLVKTVFNFMQDNNGCWLYPKVESAVTQECKVNLLTCNSDYKPTGVNLCTNKCTGSDGNLEYPCFQETALRRHCKSMRPHNRPLCGNKKSCSWACNDKRICVPEDKKLKCVNYTFWEAFAAVTKDYLPDFDLDYALVIFIAIGSFLFLFWLLK